MLMHISCQLPKPYSVCFLFHASKMQTCPIDISDSSPKMKMPFSSMCLPIFLIHFFLSQWMTSAYIPSLPNQEAEHYHCFLHLPLSHKHFYLLLFIPSAYFQVLSTMKLHLIIDIIRYLDQWFQSWLCIEITQSC